MKLNTIDIIGFGMRYYILDQEAQLSPYFNKWAQPAIQSELTKINKCKNTRLKQLRQKEFIKRYEVL